MNKPPCLNCEDRTIYCHDRCEKYQNYRKIIDKSKEDRAKELDATGYTVKNIYKFRKARNLSRGMR